MTKYFEGVIGWKDLARNLLDDHDGSIAKQIEMNYPFDHEVCIMAVVHKFLTGSNVSWKKVLESLEALELFHVANDIKKDLIAGRSPLSGITLCITSVSYKCKGKLEILPFSRELRNKKL